MNRILNENLHITRYTKKIHEINQELSTLKLMLDWELLAMHRKSEITQVEDETGHFYKITFTAHLKKTNQTQLPLDEDKT
jgi:hypothetical protein